MHMAPNLGSMETNFVYMFVSSCVFVCMCVCVCMFVYVYVYMCVFGCVYNAQHGTWKHRDILHHFRASNYICDTYFF